MFTQILQRVESSHHLKNNEDGSQGQKEMSMVYKGAPRKGSPIEKHAALLWCSNNVFLINTSYQPNLSSFHNQS